MLTQQTLRRRQQQQQQQHLQQWIQTATQGILLLQLLLLLLMVVGVVGQVVLLVAARGRVQGREVAWVVQAVPRRRSTTRDTAGPAVKLGCGSSHASQSLHWGR
jgi:hypothetical protein